MHRAGAHRAGPAVRVPPASPALRGQRLVVGGSRAKASNRRAHTQRLLDIILLFFGAAVVTRVGVIARSS